MTACPPPLPPRPPLKPPPRPSKRPTSPPPDAYREEEFKTQPQTQQLLSADMVRHWAKMDGASQVLFAELAATWGEISEVDRRWLRGMLNMLRGVRPKK